MGIESGAAASMLTPTASLAAGVEAFEQKLYYYKSACEDVPLRRAEPDCLALIVNRNGLEKELIAMYAVALTQS